MPDDFDPYADSATAVANAPGSLAADPFAFDDTAEQRRRRALQRQAKTTAFSQGQSLGQRLAPQRSEVDDLGDLLANHALPRQMKQSKTRKTLLEADLQARKAMLDEFDQQNTDLLPDLIKGKTGTAREAARAKADLAAKAAGRPSLDDLAKVGAAIPSDEEAAKDTTGVFGAMFTSRKRGDPTPDAVAAAGRLPGEKSEAEKAAAAIKDAQDRRKRIVDEHDRVKKALEDEKIRYGGLAEQTLTINDKAIAAATGAVNQQRQAAGEPLIDYPDPVPTGPDDWVAGRIKQVNDYRRARGQRLIDPKTIMQHLPKRGAAVDPPVDEREASHEEGFPNLGLVTPTEAAAIKATQLANVGIGAWDSLQEGAKALAQSKVDDVSNKDFIDQARDHADIHNAPVFHAAMARLANLRDAGNKTVGGEPIEKLISQFGGEDAVNGAKLLSTYSLAQNRLKEVDGLISHPGATEKMKKPLRDERDVLRQAMKDKEPMLKEGGLWDQVRDPTVWEETKQAGLRAFQGEEEASLNIKEWLARNLIRASGPGFTSKLTASLLPGPAGELAKQNLTQYQGATDYLQDKTAKFFGDLQTEAKSWNLDLPEQVVAKADQNIIVGRIAPFAGGLVPIWAAAMVTQGIGLAAGLTTGTANTLATVASGVSGAGVIGNSMRQEATDKLRPQLLAGKITQKEFNTARGVAEIAGTAIGTGMAVPFSRGIRLLSAEPSGRIFLSGLAVATDREGIAGAMRWLRGPGVKLAAKLPAHVGVDFAAGGGMQYGQNIGAKLTYDPDRPITQGVMETGRDMALIQLLLRTGLSVARLPSDIKAIETGLWVPGPEAMAKAREQGFNGRTVGDLVDWIKRQPEAAEKAGIGLASTKKTPPGEEPPAAGELAAPKGPAPKPAPDAEPSGSDLIDPELLKEIEVEPEPAAAVEPAKPAEAAPAGKPVPKEALFMYEQGGHRYYQVPDPGSPRGMRTVDEDTLQKEGYDLATLPKGEPVTTGEPIHATQEGIQQTIDRPQREGDEGSRPLAEAKPGGGVQPGAPVVQGVAPAQAAAGVPAGEVTPWQKTPKARKLATQMKVIEASMGNAKLKGDEKRMAELQAKWNEVKAQYNALAPKGEQAEKVAREAVKPSVAPVAKAEPPEATELFSRAAAAGVEVKPTRRQQIIWGNQAAMADVEGRIAAKMEAVKAERERIANGTKRIGDTAEPTPKIEPAKDEFTAGMNPMQAKRAQMALAQSVTAEGMPHTRRELVESDVAAGATVVQSKAGLRRLQKPNGSYRDESQISKTAMDYAEYLIAAKGGKAAEAEAVQPAQEPSYQGQHRPNSEGPPAHDLLSTDLAPRDIYDRPDLYTGEPGSVGYKESVAALKRIRGKPDAIVTVYRAAPKATLNSGDWVSFSRAYSKQHGMADNPSEDIPVHAFKVKASDVRWAGDAIEEFGYYPATSEELSQQGATAAVGPHKADAAGSTPAPAPKAEAPAAPEKPSEAPAPKFDVQHTLGAIKERLDEYESLYKEEPDKLRQLVQNTLNEHVRDDETWQAWMSDEKTGTIAQKSKAFDSMLAKATDDVVSKVNEGWKAKADEEAQAIAKRESDFKEAQAKRDTENAERAAKKKEAEDFQSVSRILKQKTGSTDPIADQLKRLEADLNRFTNERKTLTNGKEYWPEESQKLAKATQERIANLRKVAAAAEQEEKWGGVNTEKALERLRPAPPAEAPAAKAATPEPPPGATVTETPQGPKVEPTAAKERNIAKLSDRKQIKAQKEFLADAVEAAKKDAPETQVHAEQAKVDLKKLADIEDQHRSATNDLPYGKDGDERRKAADEAKLDALEPLVKKYTDLHDTEASTMESLEPGHPIEIGATSWRTASRIEEAIRQGITRQHGEHVTIEVPGDGTFRIPHTQEALQRFQDTIGDRFGKQYSFGKGRDRVTVPPPFSESETTRTVPKNSPIPALNEKPSPAEITKAVGLAQSNDETLYVLNRVVNDGKFTIATDGRRLTVAVGGDGEKLNSKGQVLDKNGKIAGTWSEDPKTKKRTFDPIQYPNWRQVVPNYVKVEGGQLKVGDPGEVTIDTTVDTGETYRLARMASLVTSEKSNFIKIHPIEGGGIGFSSESPDFGGYHSEGVTETKAGVATGGRVAVNPEFLADALAQARAMGLEKVRLIVKDTSSSVTITDGKKFLSVTMPVRLSSLESTYSPSMPVADVQTAVDAFAKANPRAPKIEVVNEPTTTENGRGVRGQYVDGKLTINAAYAGDAATVAEIANHEWAHATLDSRRGRAAITAFALREIPASEITDLKSRYAQQEGESGEDYRNRIVEEWAAQNAEKNPSLWQRIVEAVKRWLKNIFGMDTLTNEQAGRAMLRTLRVETPEELEPQEALSLAPQPADSLAETPAADATAAPSVPETPMTLDPVKDGGFESPEQFEKEFAEKSLKDASETRDEFLRRIFCKGKGGRNIYNALE